MDRFHSKNSGKIICLVELLCGCLWQLVMLVFKGQTWNCMGFLCIPILNHPLLFARRSCTYQSASILFQLHHAISEYQSSGLGVGHAWTILELRSQNIYFWSFLCCGKKGPHNLSWFPGASANSLVHFQSGCEISCFLIAYSTNIKVVVVELLPFPPMWAYHSSIGSIWGLVMSLLSSHGVK